MSEALTLRPANIADLATLQHWDEQQHVLDSDPNDDWNWETELLRNPEWRMQLMAEWAGLSVLCKSLIPRWKKRIIGAMCRRACAP